MLDTQPSLFVRIYARYWCVLNEKDCSFICITPAVKVFWRWVVNQSVIASLPRAACDASRHQSDEGTFRLHSQEIAVRKVATASACGIFTGWSRPATGALAGVVRDSINTDPTIQARIGLAFICAPIPLGIRGQMVWTRADSEALCISADSAVQARILNAVVIRGSTASLAGVGAGSCGCDPGGILPKVAETVELPTLFIGSKFVAR